MSDTSDVASGEGADKAARASSARVWYRDEQAIAGPLGSRPAPKPAPPPRFSLSALAMLGEVESEGEGVELRLTKAGYDDYVERWCLMTSRPPKEAPLHKHLSAMLRRVVFEENALLLAERGLLKETAKLPREEIALRRSAVVEAIAWYLERIEEFEQEDAAAAVAATEVAAKMASDELNRARASLTDAGRADRASEDAAYEHYVVVARAARFRDRVVALRQLHRALLWADPAFGRLKQPMVAAEAVPGIRGGWRQRGGRAYGAPRLAALLSIACGAFGDDNAYNVSGKRDQGKHLSDVQRSFERARRGDDN